MARPLRVEYPGAYYHIINRGNSGEEIFKSERDKEIFLEYLAKAAERFSLIIHTYCLMSNHYHLLIETSQPNLSTAMQWINVSYVAYYNRKRRRSGHLFQGRFKSILIDADQYLKHLSRYIHLNPVRARMVKFPAEYKWSSYSAFIGNVKASDCLETNWLLSQFGKRKKEAIKNYKNFVEDVDIKSIEDPGKEIIGGFILGGEGFVNWVKDTFLSVRKDEKEIPQLKKLKPKVSLESIVSVVCNEMGCIEEQIREKGRHRNRARGVTIFLARDLSGIKCNELGNFFGGVSGAAITQSYKQIASEVSRNRRLKNKTNKIKMQLLNI